jgi:exosome complex component RRP4
MLKRIDQMEETKKLYLPGDEIKEKITSNGIATRVENGKVYANVIGVVSNNTFKPFELAYSANINDLIVGIVYDKKPNVIFVDTGTSYTGIIQAKTLRTEIRQGNIISARVAKIEESDILLTDVVVLNKKPGIIFNIPPSKVPRIIGRDATMINIIKRTTKCDIIVGMNGMIWVTGDNIIKAKKAIDFITTRAHLEGLTAKVEEMLKK